MSSNSTAPADFATFLAVQSDEWVSRVLAPLLVKLNVTRPAKQKGSALFMRLFLVPVALAAIVTGAIVLMGASNPNDVGPVPGIVFIVSAIVLTVKGNRAARRRRLDSIATEFGIPVEDVTALEQHIVRDAKLLRDIGVCVQSTDGYQFSNDLNARVSEALVAAFLKTELFDLIKPSPDVDQQIEKVRAIRKTVDDLAKANLFNTLVSTGATIYACAEEVLTNRRDMIALFTRMGLKGLTAVEAQAKTIKAAAPVSTGAARLSARELFEEGKREFIAKKWESARSRFEQVLSEIPDHPNAQFFVGASLVEMGRTEEAIPRLEIAARRNPDHPDTNHILGIALGRCGRIAEGEVHLARAAFLGHPQSREVLTNTGMDYCGTCGAPRKSGASCAHCAARV